MYERTTQMPEPPPTGTVSKSLEATESAVFAHGGVQGYATQRWRSKSLKRILESVQGDQIYRAAS